MSQVETPLPELFARIRTGDPTAVEEVIRRFEYQVRIAIRARLTDPRVRRIVDTSDVCQSAMASFFARAALGQFDPKDPADLSKLLAQIARNKATSVHRYHTRQRRDARRADGGGDSVLDRVPGTPSAARIAANRELLAKVRSRLGVDEQEMAERRAEGQSWQEIAEALGGSPEARRKQYARAVKQMMDELGLETQDFDLES
jgi:RNA polymerase sigma factor (sigma-70 family)